MAILLRSVGFKLRACLVFDTNQKPQKLRTSVPLDRDVCKGQLIRLFTFSRLLFSTVNTLFKQKSNAIKCVLQSVCSSNYVYKWSSLTFPFEKLIISKTCNTANVTVDDKLLWFSRSLVRLRLIVLANGYLQILGAHGISISLLHNDLYTYRLNCIPEVQ